MVSDFWNPQPPDGRAASVLLCAVLETGHAGGCEWRIEGGTGVGEDEVGAVMGRVKPLGATTFACVPCGTCDAETEQNPERARDFFERHFNSRR